MMCYSSHFACYESTFEEKKKKKKKMDKEKEKKEGKGVVQATMKNSYATSVRVREGELMVFCCIGRMVYRKE